jgi:hypothetical protein
MYQDMETGHMALASRHGNRTYGTGIRTRTQTHGMVSGHGTGHMAQVPGHGNRVDVSRYGNWTHGTGIKQDMGTET